MNEQPLPPAEEVIYLPCKFCGSDDYDLADGDVDENNRYEPNGCDCCGFKLTASNHSILFH